MISFKLRHFKRGTILMLIRWHDSYSLSYRDIAELALERGLEVEHSTINRWVIKYAPMLEEVLCKRHKRPVSISWCMYETYIKVNGCICTGPLIRWGKRLISCYPKNEINRQQGLFLKRLLDQAVFLTRSPWIKVGTIRPVSIEFICNWRCFSF